MNPLEKEKLLLTVGERIRKMRLHHDKTTKEIAAHLHITTQAYGNMERGKSDISISRLIELAKFFDVPLLKILTEDHYTAIIHFENTEFLSSNGIEEKKIG
jgi:XRE family transcriptional regulator, regulator of sulfur utilization